ncbi:MAG: electron transfer flavoprotein subunit alpha/FixB family protein [Syntrophaceae bacterium]|nr:electron transfer flavoprotein subunit alpha/FixB family protein [Syntrophaceae bacterium]
MENNNQYRGVWVFVEHKGSQIEKCSLELLSLGRNLASELQVDLSTLVIGNLMGRLSEELMYYGVDVVYVVENPVLERYTTSPYHKITCDLIKEYRPEIVLFSSTPIGMDLAPRVACELKTGLVAHCVDLKIDKGKRQLLQICPYGDYMATMITTVKPQMVTVQPGVTPLPPRGEFKQGQTVQIEREIDIGNIKIIEVVKPEKADMGKIEESDVIIAIGRGVKNMSLAEKLAECLGGILGATQPIVDAGLLPESRMIGQTGKAVRPKVYIACGISGAGQHIVGMKNSGLIVAINTDEKAPIFKVADYGIIGDVSKVIPALIAALNR